MPVGFGPCILSPSAVSPQLGLKLVSVLHEGCGHHIPGLGGAAGPAAQQRAAARGRQRPRLVRSGSSARGRRAERAESRGAELRAPQRRAGRRRRERGRSFPRAPGAPATPTRDAGGPQGTCPPNPAPQLGAVGTPRDHLGLAGPGAWGVPAHPSGRGGRVARRAPPSRGSPRPPAARARMPLGARLPPSLSSGRRPSAGGGVRGRGPRCVEGTGASVWSSGVRGTQRTAGRAPPEFDSSPSAVTQPLH